MSSRMPGFIFQLLLGLGALGLTSGDGRCADNSRRSVFGPPALDKIKLMGGLRADASTPWPSGKVVKIALGNVDDAKATKHVRWKPDREDLNQVLLERAGLVGIQNFELYFEDQDGDKILVDATNDGIEEFLAEHIDHPRPKLLVEYRFPTNLEVNKVAKGWLIGNGDVTDQAVEDARKKVVGNGGKIALGSGSERSLIEHKGLRKGRLPQVVERIKSELGLSEWEAKPLLNACDGREEKGRHFHDASHGNKISTVVVAYHITCQDNKVDLIFGRYEASMEVTPTALPGQNSIQYDGINYAVWPPASPHSKEFGKDMEGLVVEIPSGWQLVDSSQKDFDNIRRRVIAPYGWHTNYLVTAGHGQLSGWKTARHMQGHPGNYFGIGNDVERNDASFHFKAASGTSYRLLIEAKVLAPQQLINDWKRFVELSAQREWSK